MRIMYHCNTKFHLAGNERFFPLIQNTTPLENFTHEFVGDAGAADVIVADVSGSPDGSAVLKKLAAAKKPDAELIVLSENYDALGVPLNEITDVWITPMSEETFGFKFKKWQERFKNDKDRWQSEQYLNALIDNIPSMVWFKARDGSHEKVNADFCRTVGKTREDVTGKKHTYIWDVPEDDPACVESDNRAMDTETTVVSEEHIATKSGERELTSYKSPLYDLDGSVMGTVGFAVDITKERAFENEIITKNKTLENMFASIDCGMMWHSVNGKDIYFINNTALKILDYKSVEELIENGFDYVAKSVIEEDRERLSEQIRSLKNTGDSVNVEYRVRHKDGKILHIMGNIKLMEEEDGRQFYQRYLLDVTERKKESSEKEHRREELVQVLAANYSVVCYFDLNTGYGSAHHINDSESDELRGLFNGRLELESTIARYCERFVNVEDRVLLKTNCDRAFLKRTLAQKGSHFINFRVTYGGEESYYRIKAVKVGSDVDVFGIVLGIRSVDEEIRRQMEDKELLEHALRQANRANRAKSTFLSNMSHDIRTPMNAIVGFTTLALSHVDSREQVEGYLRKIMTSGNHLLSLINDVLDMSRIESGKMTLDEKQCELPDILHELCNMIRPEVMKKQMELRMDTASIRHEAVVCDRLRLNQVLLNLLSNSVKYTPDGGTITFGAVEKPSVNADSAMFEFTVSDNGMGMSEEFVQHIFEPFERERNSTMSGIQGTGLGMAITKNIVEMMNGTIDVKSAPGKGTEVKVLLEFKILESAADTGRLEGLRDLRALVADDDPNTCESIAGMLGELGIKADRALSGKEAVLLAKQAAERGEGYGVYLIDYKMPEQSGIETAHMICEETGGDVPIIMVTAYDRAEIEAEARQAGVRAFCSKPLFMSELKNCLESLFRTDEKPEDRKRSGRILLVEDNDLNQEIAVTMLTEEGFEVDVAENGKLAVDMLSASEERHYGVVLMDIQMPVMNGYEATKCIRALENEAHRNIPIIAMTANAFAEDKKEALQCGMNGHLAKPIDIDTLLKMLDEFL